MLNERRLAYEAARNIAADSLAAGSADESGGMYDENQEDLEELDGDDVALTKEEILGEEQVKVAAEKVRV